MIVGKVRGCEACLPADNAHRFSGKEKPGTLTSKVLGSGDVLLIRAFLCAHPLPLAGRTVHPPASRLGVFSARVGDGKTKCPAHLTTCWALCSGDVLLIRIFPHAHPSGFPSISLDSRRLGSLRPVAVLE